MKAIQQILLGSALLLSLYGCGKVPITGRSSLNMVSDEALLSQSQQAYSGFVSQARQQGAIVQDERIQRITVNLINATNTYLTNNGYSDIARNMQWELNVVKSKEVNAFCMPGGKIVVYTGLAQLVGLGTGADDEMAAVIGHEIGHAIARHANERVSRSQLQGMGAQVLGGLLGMGSNDGSISSAVLSTLYGLGAQAVAMPFNRKQELEADKIGLVLMALAGYNPEYAVSLWQKMEKNSGGTSSSFWSTHPSEAKRIKEIQAYMPEAKKYYQKPLSTQRSTLPTPTTKKTSTTTKKKK